MESSQSWRYRKYSPKTATLIIAATLLLIFLYTRGTFDYVLYKVHLNYQECAMNGFGATFCGDDLEQYKIQIGQN